MPICCKSFNINPKVIERPKTNFLCKGTVVKHSVRVKSETQKALSEKHNVPAKPEMIPNDTLLPYEKQHFLH